MGYLSAILFFIGSFILLVVSWRIGLFLRKNPNIVGERIGKMTLLSGVGMGIYSFVLFFFPNNSFVLGLFNILVETLYLITFVYGFSLFIYLVFPQVSQRKVLSFGFLMVLFATVSHFVFFPYPTVDNRGVLHFNAPVVPGTTYILFSVVGLLPLAIAFLHKGIKSPSLRRRSLLFSTALFFIIISGVLVSVFTQTLIYIFSFFLQALGFVLLLITIVLKPQKEDFRA